jgi:ribosomal protein L7/L12
VLPDLTEDARTLLAAGASPDDIARVLLGRSTSKIAVIKALHVACGMSLDDAKWVMHRNLDPQEQAAAERLWGDLLQALEAIAERPVADQPLPGESAAQP